MVVMRLMGTGVVSAGTAFLFFALSIVGGVFFSANVMPLLCCGFALLLLAFGFVLVAAGFQILETPDESALPDRRR